HAVFAGCQPVSIGIPLPRGAVLALDDLSLFDSDGVSVPLQSAALARWPDKSVQWALLDWVPDSLPPGESLWTVLSDPTRSAFQPESVVKIDATNGGFRVDAGRVVFDLDSRHAWPVRQGVIDGSALTCAGAWLFRQASGKSLPARVEEVTVEAA